MSNKERYEENISLGRVNKYTLYWALTGHDRFDSGAESMGAHHPLNVNVTIPAEMDKTYLLVKKMQRQYMSNDELSKYYDVDFQEIDKAYLNSDNKKFESALERLLTAMVLE